MNHEPLFSSKDKTKKIKVSSAAIFRINVGDMQRIFFLPTSKNIYYKACRRRSQNS